MSELPAEFQAVLLAGGLGERLYPLTQKSCKALLPIANEPMIFYPLTWLERAGFTGRELVLTLVG